MAISLLPDAGSKNTGGTEQGRLPQQGLLGEGTRRTRSTLSKQTRWRKGDRQDKMKKNQRKKIRETAA